ncbi:MAG: cation diffusion facilitator family transporter [Peptococcaceae bacterium]
MFSQFLIRLFIKDYQKTKDPRVRAKYGYLSGIIGIIANLVLFTVKLITGLALNSIAFIGDALNNLTDVVSSLVTILGFKLAGKPADAEHPFGHGRLEYIAGLIVSFLVILVGYELLKSSLDRIIHPVSVSFTLPAFLIVIFALFMKCWLSLFNRRLARTINSQALSATSLDSLSDMISTGCIGLSLLASLWSDFPFDGYVGVIVAGIILYSGISLTRETINPLLGEVPEQELVKKITDKIRSYEGVVGVHDLIVHNYGPEQYMASIHVEVPSDKDIMELHELIDHIERQTAGELGILLTIHMDPLNVDSAEIQKIRAEIARILRGFPLILSFHDFRIVGKEERENLIFDIVVKSSLTQQEEQELRRAVIRKIQEKHPHFNCIITIDKDYTS